MIETRLNKIKTSPRSQDEEALVKFAVSQGATEALILSAEDISTDEKLARFCVTPGCENYGQSKSCPPHVEGPATFTQWLSTYTRALFFKIEVPSELLFSHDRRELFELLHRATAAIEIEAKTMGYSRAKGFAGGSCKATFCYDKLICRVIGAKEGKEPLQKGTCRFPDAARPSMSGYGVNVSGLIATAGWDKEPLMDGEPSKKTAGLYGLVLIR
ncbi:MAG: DUF2284 domain-containing protein [Desulfobacterales bacterium]|nr:DUF2284 domain-containing protein [Desulfobacterales bacterium]